MAGNEKEEEPATLMEEDDKITNDDPGNGATADQETSDKLIRLPLTRIKHIMKSDPDVTLSSQEAVVMLAKATELFVHMLSADAVTHTVQSKRKTLQRKDLDNILDARDCYSFLEGIIDS
ncbi:DNA polymerase epsilon subunit 4-like [Liolophura sinensis]|uniref:DNA polymerase epsilon subunit 4-like n=1 Tax=Liolophura sinensis TaxID=3198878 RepID=UPI0031588479